MLRRLVKVSAAMLGGGLLVTGCAPVKMGAAAILGNQRVTIATLDTEVTNLSQTVKQYPGIISLNQAQITQQTLTWLVRFQINEELARQAGITVTPGLAQRALAQIYVSAKAQAQAAGVANATLSLILAANGIPPNMSAELGRYQAIEIRFVEDTNGGKIPTSNSAQTAATAKLKQAQCLAAKTLNIVINPQFGQMDYTQYKVVPAPPSVSRPEGPATAASPSGLAPAC